MRQPLVGSKCIVEHIFALGDNFITSLEKPTVNNYFFWLCSFTTSKAFSIMISLHNFVIFNVAQMSTSCNCHLNSLNMHLIMFRGSKSVRIGLTANGTASGSPTPDLSGLLPKPVLIP